MKGKQMKTRENTVRWIVETEVSRLLVMQHSPGLSEQGKGALEEAKFIRDLVIAALNNSDQFNCSTQFENWLADQINKLNVLLGDAPTPTDVNAPTEELSRLDALKDVRAMYTKLKDKEEQGESELKCERDGSGYCCQCGWLNRVDKDCPCMPVEDVTILKESDLQDIESEEWTNESTIQQLIATVRDRDQKIESLQKQIEDLREENQKFSNAHDDIRIEWESADQLHTEAKTELTQLREGVEKVPETVENDHKGLIDLFRSHSTDYTRGLKNAYDKVVATLDELLPISQETEEQKARYYVGGTHQHLVYDRTLQDEAWGGVVENCYTPHLARKYAALLNSQEKGK